MQGSLTPRYALAAHVDDELDKYYETSKRGAGTRITTNTMAAPLTHGIAPVDLTDLREISLRQAIERVNAIQSDCILFVKTWKPAYRVDATALCVEDSNGDVMMLNLYYYVRLDEDPQLIFPCGTYLAILQPYLRFALDNPTQPIMIRTDNPQTIVVFDNEVAWNAARRGNWSKLATSLLPSLPLILLPLLPQGQELRDALNRT
jgi:hypothetical protein